MSPPVAISADGARHRAEYARRIHRVLNYIDQHLDQPLVLAQLADVANFSRFHFHRIFAASMGETLGDYARRRRLEKAAFRLSTGSDDSVLQTALATGFGSGEAFARAFKLKFGCTPSAWRDGTPARLARQAAALGGQPPRGPGSGGDPAGSNPDQADSNPDQARAPGAGDHGASPTPQGTAHMNVLLIDFPATTVAWHRLIGPYGPAIGVFWRGTVAPWMRAHGLQDQPRYGIGYNDPSVTPPDKCRYDACVAVPAELAASLRAGGQADIMTLPAGRYAVLRYQGPPIGLAQAWMRLTREWLPSSGLQCDDRPCFERYEGLPQAGAELRCELCIPVRAL